MRAPDSGYPLGSESLSRGCVAYEKLARGNPNEKVIALTRSACALPELDGALFGPIPRCARIGPMALASRTQERPRTTERVQWIWDRANPGRTG